MPPSAHRPRPVVLCILDGFGYREDAPDNAISVANAPTWRKIWNSYPHALLEASGEAVGLPAGQMGNSEVGHMNLGAGRVVFQDLPMIDRAIAQGELAKNPRLLAHISKLKASGGVCHLMGLASPGGVHSHQAHLVVLAKEIAGAGVPVAIHAFLDGRDVPPQSAADYLEWLAGEVEKIPGAKIMTVCGRYYAMDRDKRWERVEKAYNLLMDAEGAKVDDVVQAISHSYVDGVYDEFVLPVARRDYKGMQDGDSILFVNFRADRAREILCALLLPDFDGFKRKRVVTFLSPLGMVEYSDVLAKLMLTLFPPKVISNGLGEVMASAGLKQLRIAETEKYPHVTFFFNGGREEAYAGEERIMVPSPKVPTYDLQPEMSAREVTDKVVKAIESNMFDLIVLNFANPDMVGHTGSLSAAVRAVETIDGCLARVLDSVSRMKGAAFVTADHGNCEIMFDKKTDGPHTAHTLSKVPAVLLGGPLGARLKDGRLADVAPTLLALMGMAKPKDMDGDNLVI